jgi:hypothetical protein
MSLKVEGYAFCRDLYVYEVLSAHERMDKWIAAELRHVARPARNKTLIRARWAFTVRHIRTLKQVIERLPRITGAQLPQGFEENPTVVRLLPMSRLEGGLVRACTRDSSNGTLESVTTHSRSLWTTTFAGSSVPSSSRR